MPFKIDQFTKRMRDVLQKDFFCKMDVISILVFATVFLISYIILSKRKNLPPGPPSIPFIGSYFFVKELLKGKRHVGLMEAAEKYGNVYCFRMASYRLVVLNGYDTIYQALVKQAAWFSDRPNYLWIFKRALKDGKGIILESYNNKWKTMRKFTQHALRDFGVGKTSIEDKIMAEIDAASTVLQETEGEAFEIGPLLQNIIGNIIYGIIFGKRYEYDDPKFELIRNMAGVTVRGQGIIDPVSFFPRWFLSILARKRAKESRLRIENMLKIREHIYALIAEHEETFDKNHIRDFIDLYIQVKREKQEDVSEVFTKGNMLRVILDLFIAGFETTSNTLDWAFLHMSEYPDIQQKCQAEIEEVVGDKQITYADRGKLKYVDATLMEVQRLAITVPIGAPHSTSEDVVFMGYFIPKNTIVIPNLYSATRDLNYWVEPTKFDPSRFIDKEGKLIKQDPLIPFSVGPRACMGESLARMKLFLVFANMLQRFEFEKEDVNFKHSMNSKPNQVIQSPLSYKLRLKKRKWLKTYVR